MNNFRGGFGGFNNGNLQQLMKQAQKMQEDMQKKKDEIEATDFKGSAGGGMVECVLNGKKEVKSITIKPEVIDPDDKEMLEDLVVSAVNDALNKFKEAEKNANPMGM